jgi:hypothetical protein
VQTSTEARPSPVAMIVGIIGGALLTIGSFLTWASVSVDTDALVNKLAEALNVDPAVLQGSVPTTGFSQSVSGMQDGADGIFTLVAGILVLIFAGILFVKFDLRKVMGGLMVAAGLVGGGVALWDISQLNDAKDAALAEASTALQALGVDGGTLSDVIEVSAGIGIYACALGGVVAIIAGIMALTQKAPMVAAPAMGASMGSTPSTGSGFEAAPTAPSPSMPPAPVETPDSSTAATEPGPTDSTPEPPASPEGGTST